MNILGLKIRGHDTGAAIVTDKNIHAISEERLNRIKYSSNIFPSLAIQYCLRTENLKPEDIDLIVIDQIADKDAFNMEKIFRKESTALFPRAHIKVINHHLAHAASAFFCSPFDEAAIMVVDGTGEKIRTHLGDLWETETLYFGKGTDMRELQKTLHRRDGNTFRETFGIGKLYSYITERYLRFSKHNEGKTMGLASYGDAEEIFRGLPRELWMKEINGHFVCNPKIVFPKSPLKERVARMMSTGRPFNFLYSLLLLGGRRAVQEMRNIIVTPSSMQASSSDIFKPVLLSMPPRSDATKLPSPYYNNVAAVVQALIEDVFLGISRRLSGMVLTENICIAGGCGLNGVSNHKILAEGVFKHMFIQPASSDAGIPLGCALWGYHVFMKKPRRYVMKNAYLGREYPDKEIHAALEQTSNIVFRKSTDIANEAADAIAKGEIVGWFQSSSEYGPRALGARSILCDPRVKDAKDILNEKVKHREGWRPFAASIIKEHLQEYFDVHYEESPYMLLVAEVRKEKRSTMAALVHVDGTCRMQTVTEEDNGLYYRLIEKFYQKTSLPLILNTSFNLAGEPIVETPQDALQCFLKTKMDVLIMNDFIIRKSETA